MSVIAESLNRVKNNNNKKRKININLTFIKFSLIFLIIIICSILFINSINFIKKNFYKNNKKIPNVENYLYIFNKKLQDYKNFKIDYKLKLDYWVASNNLNALINFIQKNNNLPIDEKNFYKGIIFLRKGFLNKAEIKFKNCLKNSFRKDQVLAYLGEINFKKGDLLSALNYYSKIKNKTFNVYLNIGIIYENLNDIEHAISFYNKSLNKINNPFLKKRILNKLFLLKENEKKYY